MSVLGDTRVPVLNCSGAMYRGVPRLRVAFACVLPSATGLALREEQVLGLQIAMHDARLVRLVERHRGLVRERDGLLRREAPDARQSASELLPAKQLHDEERHAGRLVVAGVEHVDDELAV